MVLDCRQQGLQVTIGGQNFSHLVAGLDFGSPILDQSGLSPRDGTIDIYAFPLESVSSPVDTDPRTNPALQFGSPVTVQISDSVGNTTLAFSGYILKTPLPAQRGLREGKLSISIADDLIYRMDRDVPGDESGVSLGTSKSKSSIANSLLNKLGLTGNLSIPGSLSAPIPKINSNSFASQLGELCYSELKCVRCDSSGIVDSEDIKLTSLLSSPPYLTVVLGEDEISYEYQTVSGENAANCVITLGEKQVVEDSANPKTYVKREYSKVREIMNRPLSTIEGDDRVVTSLKRSVTETWTGSTFTSVENIVRLLDLGGKSPERVETDKITTKYFESGDEGKLKYETHTESGILADQRFGLLDGISNTTIPLTTPITLKKTTVYFTYYPNGVPKTRVETFLESRYLDADNLDVLTPFTKKVEEWIKVGDKYDYRYEYYEVGALIGSRTEDYWNLQLRETDTKNGVNPPSTERKDNLKSWETVPLEGKARFVNDLSVGYDRTREYSVPYAESSYLLDVHAKEFGLRLLGGAQAAIITLPILDELIEPPILFRMDVVERSGKIISYAATGHSWGFESNTREFQTNLLYLGTVENSKVKTIWTSPVEFDGTLELSSVVDIGPPRSKLEFNATLELSSVFTKKLFPLFFTYDPLECIAEFEDGISKLRADFDLECVAEFEDSPSKLIFDATLELSQSTSNILTPSVEWLSDVEISEGDSGTTFGVVTLSMNNASNSNVTVNYQALSDTSRPANEQPTDFTDYDPIVSGVSTFSPGDTLSNVTVDIVGDTDEELTEYILLRILSTNVKIGNKSQAILSILDDDSANNTLGWVALTSDSNNRIVIGDANGLVWTGLSLSTKDNFRPASASDRGLIAVGDGKVVIGGYATHPVDGGRAAVLYANTSDDLTLPSNWNVSYSGIPVVSTFGALRRVTYTGDGFAALIDPNTVNRELIYSSDGINWNVVPHSGRLDSLCSDTSENDVYVFDNKDTIRYTNDLSSSSNVTNTIPSFGIVTADVSIANGGIIVVGRPSTTSSNNIAVSSNRGVDYDTLSTGISVDIEDFYLNGNSLLIASAVSSPSSLVRCDDVLAISPNFSNVGDSDRKYAVDGDGTIVIAAGDNGTYIRSVDGGSNFGSDTLMISGMTGSILSIAHY